MHPYSRCTPRRASRPRRSTSPSSFRRRTKRRICRSSWSRRPRRSPRSPHRYEVIVIDDGSVDRDVGGAPGARRAISVPALARHRARRGIADALRTGYLAARGDVLVFYPADLQFKPEDIPRLVAPILAGDADMVTGFKEGKYEKAFVSGIYNGLSRTLFHVPVKDLNSVKAYRREIMDALPVRPDWHRYMIVIAAAQGFTVTEIPVPLYPRHAGKSKFATWHAFRSACSTCSPCGSSSGSARSRCCCSACSASASFAARARRRLSLVAARRRTPAFAPSGRSSRPASSSAASSSRPDCSANRSPGSARSFARSGASSTSWPPSALKNAKSMKVLFLTHSFPRQPGDAAGSFVLRLATALRGEGVETRVVAPAAPGLPGSRDRSTAFRVERFRYAPRKYETLAYGGNMATQVQAVVERQVHDARLPRRRVPLGGARAPRVRAGRRARALVVSERPRRHVARHAWRTSRSSRRCTAPTCASRAPSRFRARRFATSCTTPPPSPRCRTGSPRRRRRSCPTPAPIVAPMPVATDLFSPGGARHDEPLAVRRAAQQAEGNRDAAARAEPHPGHIGRARRRRRRRRSRARCSNWLARSASRDRVTLARRRCRSPSSSTSIAARRRSSFRRSTKGLGWSPSKRSCARRRSSRSTPAACRTSCSTIAPACSCPRSTPARSRRRWSRCSSVTIAARRSAPPAVCTRSPPLPPSRLPDATPTSTAPPSPARRNRLWLAAQIVIAAVVLVVRRANARRAVAGRIGTRHLQVAPAVGDHRSRPALVVLATYAILIETWRRIVSSRGARRIALLPTRRASGASRTSASTCPGKSGRSLAMGKLARARERAAGGGGGIVDRSTRSSTSRWVSPSRSSPDCAALGHDVARARLGSACVARHRCAVRRAARCRVLCRRSWRCRAPRSRADAIDLADAAARAVSSSPSSGTSSRGCCTDGAFNCSCTASSARRVAGSLRTTSPRTRCHT